MGSVATGMANGPVQDLFAPVANGDLDSRMHAGPVEALDAAPQGINRILANACSGRVLTIGIPEGDGFKVLGNLADVEGTAGKSVHQFKPFSVTLLFFYLPRNRPVVHWPGRNLADVTASTRSGTRVSLLIMDPVVQVRHGDTISTALLGQVHCLVGGGTERGCSLPVIGIDRNAYTDGQRHLLAIPQRLWLFRHFAPESLGRIPGFFKIHFRQNDDELLTAKPANSVDTAHAAQQQATDGPEDRITGSMAEGIVHILEMVKINPEYRHGSLIPPGPVQFLLQKPGHFPAVEQAGQRITGSHFLQLIFKGLTIGTVQHDAFKHNSAIFFLDAPATLPHPDPTAILAGKAIFQRKRFVVVQSRLHLSQDPLTVLFIHQAGVTGHPVIDKVLRLIAGKAGTALGYEQHGPMSVIPAPIRHTGEVIHQDL